MKIILVLKFSRKTISNFLFFSVFGAQREPSKTNKEVTPGSGTNQNNIEVEETRTGPYFDKAASKNLTALLGKTAYLNCRVKNLGNKTVSGNIIEIFLTVI